MPLQSLADPSPSPSPVPVPLHAQQLTLSVAQDNQLQRIRAAYLRAQLRSDVSWYDVNEPGEVAGRLTEDTLGMAEGLGEKLGQGITQAATFLTGYIVAFAVNP